jgi:hypothetical protein
LINIMNRISTAPWVEVRTVYQGVERGAAKSTRGQSSMPGPAFPPRK